MKKAQISEAALIVFSLIAIAFIITIFYLIIDFTDDPETRYRITSYTSDLDMDIMMDNILMTPVIYEGENVLARDLIILMHDKCRYKDIICTKFIREIEPIFDNMMVEHKFENYAGNDKDCYRSYRFKVTSSDKFDKSAADVLDVESSHYINDVCGDDPVRTRKEIEIPDGSIVYAWLETSMREE